MCYSAEVWIEFEKFLDEFPDTDIDIKAFVKLYLGRQGSFKFKTPKGLDRNFDHPKTTDEKKIHALIEDFNAGIISASEQEIFKQAKRLADAERKLAEKETKGALESQRIATNKIAQLKSKISSAKRSTRKPEKDNRIFPLVYAPVLINEGGRHVIRPMRYGCRPAGKPSSYDTRYPGSYNARRDNLEGGFWGGTFGYTHGLIPVTTFYENVEGEGGKNKVIQFEPDDGSTMFVACLYSHWIDPKGKEPELWSFAMITDEPLPEISEAGHDRLIVSLKPEHIEAWLNPDPNNLEALYAMMDDKRRPYYEHREAA